MIGTTFANRYEIMGRLGEGANDVWKAHDTHQQQDVALKTFRPGSSAIHVYGEATILTALEGEHVLRVYNADTFDVNRPGFRGDSGDWISGGLGGRL